ncbi:MAG: ROK family protein [Ardenticatenaceae bacterium]|nr:ROK family protein [Anaerolineales bacterium]MCB8923472.1 ROK family protein [Ardenticatenaceae bacterium]MCB8991373.1 ROK family protein [Ardenticatenaceae bacterium]MCB9003803.1 ROK family protein [Ardenticatenaceae bacterium]
MNNPSSLTLHPSSLLLALDFGGTKLTAAVLSVDRQLKQPAWLAHKRIFTPAGTDARYELETMIALGHELLAGRPVTAVGVSFGGPVDHASGTVRLSHHVPGWHNFPLQQRLEAEFGVPVRVDNDANTAALGEWRFGAGRGVNSLLYITVSTGVGGGWILGGQSWRGHEGMAGEIGHTVVDPNGPMCLCGKRGCVERLASGPYMAQDYRAQVQGHGLATGKAVAEAAANGDVIARSILQRSAWALGVGIGNAANFINPQLFVLGGGVTKAGPLWWDEVRRAAHETAMPEVHFTIIPAQFADDAPLWGAVALVEGVQQ